jgi:hypothetical protein
VCSISKTIANASAADKTYYTATLSFTISTNLSINLFAHLVLHINLCPCSQQQLNNSSMGTQGCVKERRPFELSGNESCSNAKLNTSLGETNDWYTHTLTWSCTCTSAPAAISSFTTSS